MKVYYPSLFLILIGFLNITQAQEVTGNWFGEDQLKKGGIDLSSEYVIQPLEVGTQAPDFKALDREGSQVSLNGLLEKGPVVIIFYRGYWCPVCKKHLSNFEKDLSLLREKGVQVVAISPETIENIETTIEKTDMSIQVIPDRDYQIMKSYGVAFEVSEKYQKKIKTFLFTDIAEANGHEEAVLPIPATYVIGQDGIIRFVHFDPDYKNRADVNDLLFYLD